MRFVLSNGVSYYRLALPIEFMPDRFDAGGVWHALLTIGRPRLERSNTRDGSDQTIRRAMAPQSTVSQAPLTGVRAQRAAVLAAEQFATAVVPGVSGQRTVPYSVVVHSYSNLSLTAHTEQNSFEPGASVTLHAYLAQSGIPLANQAQVWADITQPDNLATTAPMQETGDGSFMGQFVAARPGVYRIRIRARGTTMTGEPFTREKTLTAAVWRGGDRPIDPTGSGQAIVDYLRDHDARLCEMLRCLASQPGLNPEQIRKCMDVFCKDRNCCGGH